MRKKIKYLVIILAVLVVVALGLIYFTNIYKVFLSPLEIGIDISPTYGDTILVLGGGLRKGPEIGYSTLERLRLAIELYRQKERTIIISDGSLYRRSPAIKKMTDFLVENGVSKNFIRLEGKSQTTFDNFFNTREILEEVNAGEVIVCTSPYHQKRAEMILNYLKIKNFKIAQMEHSEIHDANSIRQRARNSWLIFREYLAIIKFKLFKK